MRTAAIAAGLVLAGCATLDLPKPGDIRIPPFQLRMRDLRLPSGMRVVIQEDHRMPYAAVVTVVGAGSSHDYADKEGLAHLVQHLAVRAAVTATVGLSATRALESFGAVRWQAYTARDHTVFFELVPKVSLEATLAMEARRILDPVAGVTPEIFSVEREVVRNELRERAEMAVSGQALEWLALALFEPGHPYRRPLLGTHATLSSIALEDARRFAVEMYRPENVTMVIAGDIDISTADALIVSTFPPNAIGDPKHPIDPPVRGAVAVEPPSPPDVKTLHQTALPGSIARPEVWIAWTLPGSFNERSLVDERMLYAAIEQILRYELSDPQRDIERWQIYTIRGKLSTIIACRLELRDGVHAEESASDVLDQLMALRLENDTCVNCDTVIHVETGLARGLMRRRIVRWNALTDLVFDSDDLIQRAIETAELAHFSGSALLDAGFLEALRALPDTHLSRLAEKYLARDRARMVFVTPTEEPRASAQRDVVPIDAAAEEGRTPRHVPLSALYPQEVGRESRQFRLDNGLDVYIVRGRGGAVVDVALVFFGGPAADELPGVAEMEDRVVFSRERHNGHWLDYGAKSTVLGRRDAKTWWSRAAAGNTENMLAILAERMSTLDVEPGAVAEFERRAADRARRDEALPKRQAERSFLRALWGAHPYGRVVMSEDLERLGFDDVEARLERIYHPANAALIVSGAVDVAETEAQVRRWFEKWRSDGRARTPPPLEHTNADASTPKVIITDHPAATLIQVTLGCVLDSDVRVEATHDVLAAIVGDGMNDRLREELGVTFGVVARADRLRGGISEIRIDAQIELPRADRALALIAERWTAWANGLSTVEEIDRARWTVARSKADAIFGARGRARELIRRACVEDPPGSVDKYPAFLQAVAKPTVDRAFAACNRGMAVSIVGPQSALERAIPAAWRAAR
jgi:zinc protease